MKIEDIDLLIEQKMRRAMEAEQLWKHLRSVYVPLFLELADIEATNLSWDGEPNISVTGDKALLLKCFRALRRAGFKHFGEPPRVNQTSWYNWFYHTDAEKQPVDIPRIWFSFSSTVCRRVQVGTRMEEIPVYQISCGDEADIGLLDGLEAAGLSPIVIGEDSDIPS